MPGPRPDSLRYISVGSVNMFSEIPSIAGIPKFPVAAIKHKRAATDI
jgi:hypothetical protein